ncbi:hypothetical protein DFH08DRAFT_947975 [Mycena albidolilacea]|uniref:Uncharacterized protein n=1 Tax=Mycena albidolilacea TaxID=1033008 RepID=A0AAD7F7V3_9AGAR|nr:hypothetical protein DFH08DRAFT_947975 [Mycena albidolilacea]
MSVNAFRLMKGSCGNPGYFHGVALDFLQKHLPLYLATPSQKKEVYFWRVFNPEWDEQYPSLDSTELEELVSEEKTYEDEKQTVKEHNKLEWKRHRHKANWKLIPTPGDCLFELRMRSVDRKKLRSWYLNAKTKDKTWKVEPFWAWLGKLSAAQGSPHRLHLPWVVWRHETHGDVLCACYHERYGQDPDEDQQDTSEADGFETATAGKKGGEREGQQSNSRDGEKEGQEKEDKEEGEREEGEGDHAPTHAELLQRKYHLAKAYFDELSKDEQEEVVKIREDDYQD